MSQVIVPKGSNLKDWEEAWTQGNADSEPVKPRRGSGDPKMMDDPLWAGRIRRALADSQAGRVIVRDEDNP